MSRDTLVFWAKRWKDAHDLYKKRGFPYLGVPDLVEVNYSLYLTEVYSWMFENRKVNH